jgi:hypothetical protein
MKVSSVIASMCDSIDQLTALTRCFAAPAALMLAYALAGSVAGAEGLCSLKCGTMVAAYV